MAIVLLYCLFSPGKAGKLVKGSCLFPPFIPCGVGGGKGGVEVEAVWKVAAEQGEQKEMKGTKRNQEVYWQIKSCHLAIEIEEAAS